MKNKRTILWLQVFIWVGIIYSTLSLVRPICNWLKDNLPFNLFINFFLVGFVVVILTIMIRRGLWQWSRILMLMLTLSLYGVGVWYLRIPEERIHFVQYGILTFLLIRALGVDFKGWRLYVLAIIIGSLFGLGDEGIQYLLPNRYFSWKDVILNCVSCVLGSMLVISFHQGKKS